MRESRSAWNITVAALGLAAFWLLLQVVRRFGGAYVVRRVLVLTATLLVATLVVFVIVQVVPGDPVRYMMGLQADPDALTAMRHELALDLPLQRYGQWIVGLFHGDFGVSYTYRVPVGALVAERLQVSLPLAVMALLLSSALAFPLGLVAAARRGRTLDTALGGLTQVGLALPNFWLGMLLVLLFAVSLHWVSAGGFPAGRPGLGRH